MDRPKEERGNEGPGQAVQAPTSWLARLAARLKGLDELKGGFLALVGVVYVLGYGVWSYYAWRNDLGLLPVLRFQYLVAGFPPLLSLVAIYLARRGLIWLRDRGLSRLGGGWQKAFIGLWLLLSVFVTRNLVFLIIIAVLLIEAHRDKRPPLWASALALVLVLIAVKTASFQAAWLDEHVPRWATYVIILVFTVLSYLLPDLPEKLATLNWFRVLGRIYSFFLVVFLPVVFFFLFVESVYPHIPQELGGARPRCAYLDVRVKDLSQQSLGVLVPHNSAKTDTEVVRSAQVEILYSTGESILLRPADTGAPVLELARSSITAIRSCS